MLLACSSWSYCSHNHAPTLQTTVSETNIRRHISIICIHRPSWERRTPDHLEPGNPGNTFPLPHICKSFFIWSSAAIICISSCDRTLIVCLPPCSSSTWSRSTSTSMVLWTATSTFWWGQALARRRPYTSWSLKRTVQREWIDCQVWGRTLWCTGIGHGKVALT